MSDVTSLIQHCMSDGCSDEYYGKGFCGRHYQRWRKLGSLPLEALDAEQVAWLLEPRRPGLSVEERFWQKVDKDGPLPTYRPDLGRCWIWKAGQDGHGYGAASRGGGRMDKAHRVSLRIAGVPMPAGHHVDHLCRVTLCVNPSHLEVVTPRENALRGRGSAPETQRRKSHCPAGHPYDETNTYVLPSRPTARYCKACQRDRDRSTREMHRLRNALHVLVDELESPELRRFCEPLVAEGLL